MLYGNYLLEKFLPETLVLMFVIMVRHFRSLLGWWNVCWGNPCRVSCDINPLINRSCESEWVYSGQSIGKRESGRFSGTTFTAPTGLRRNVRCTDFEMLSFYEIAICSSHRLTSSSNSKGQELAGIYKLSRGLVSFRLAAETFHFGKRFRIADQHRFCIGWLG